MNPHPHPTGKAASLQQRADLWLWVSRFYKTRNNAAKAIGAGHVKVNGVKCKAAKALQAGDQLQIRHQQLEYNVTVVALSKQRLSAAKAALLYTESESSRIKREEQIQLAKNNRLGIRYDRKKPDKQDRRKRINIKQQSPK